MEWLFIIFIVAVFGILYAIYKISEKFVKEGKPEVIDTITTTTGAISTGLDLLDGIVKALDKDPENESPMERLTKWSKLAVGAVYQEMGSVKEYFENHPELSIDDVKTKLKETAMAKVNDMATIQIGRNLTDKEKNVASSIIEVAVLALKLTLEKKS